MSPVKIALWAELIWLLLLGIVLLTLDPMRSLGGYMLLILGLFAFRPWQYWQYIRTHGSKRLPWRFVYIPTPITVPTNIIILAIGISVLTSAQFAVSLSAAGQALFGIALATALMHDPLGGDRPVRIGQIMVAFGAGLTLVSPLVTDWKEQSRLFSSPLYGWLEGIAQTAPDRIHANILAGALALCIPIVSSFWLALQASRIESPAKAAASYRRKQSFYVALLAFMIVVLLLTQSRGAYVAALCGTLIVLGIRQIRRWLWLILPVLSFIGLLGFFRQSEIQALLLSTDGTLGGWLGRLDVWQNSLLAIRDFPYTGLGIGTFTQTMPRLYPLRVDILDYPHAHNVYLQVGVDIGLIGLISFLAILLLLLSVLTWLACRPSPHDDPPTVWLIGGALGALVALILHGFVDTVVWDNRLSFMSWLLFSYAAAIISKEIRKVDLGA